MSTTISQQCQAVLTASGVTRFEITTSVTVVEPGDLPQKEIFVHRIDAKNDPKADVFQRIATLVDLTSLPLGREAALAQGKTTYLGSVFTLSYPDLAVATEAKKLVQARIDRLITDWRTYTTDFGTSTVAFPLVPSGVVTARIDAFRVAKAAWLAAESAAVDAAAALADAQAEAARQSTALTGASTARLECAEVASRLTSLVTAEAAFRGSANTLLSALANAVTLATKEEIAQAVNDARDTFQRATHEEEVVVAGGLTAVKTTVDTSCASKQVTLESTVTAKATADGAVATAENALTGAQAEATAAKAAAEAAYATAKETCTSFTDPDME